MNKKVIIYIAIVLVIAAALVAVSFFNAATDNGSAVTVVSGSTGKAIALGSLKTKVLQLETANGKGEKNTAQYKGVELSDFLTQNGFKLDGIDSIELLAQDKFTAKLTGDEAREKGKVYIVTEKNGETILGIDKKSKGAQIIVVGDPNSKRCVNYLEKITLNAK